jgi:8-oxo-dGTP pyrophosphatase MutT (NUDIX family)
MSVLFDHLKRLFDEGHGTELPGLRTDAMFAPPGEVRAAAVLIAVTDRREPGVLLTHRPHGMRQHAGQVAFPGGKLDPGEDAVAAALREAHEELAIDASHVKVIGASDRFITGTGYDITPVLGLVPHDIAITPNPIEVEDWFEAPLRFLLDPANQIEKEATYGGHHRRYIEIEWDGHRIWGVTAAIIANLTRRLGWQEPVE